VGVFQGDSFWDPVPFSWPLMLIMLAVCLLLTIAFLVWTAVQSDKPDTDPGPLLDRATARDRKKARTVQRRLDADAGRADTSEPELR